MASNQSKLKLKWSRLSKQRLIEIGKYIKKDSPANAIKVVEKIREVARKIPDYPEHIAYARKLNLRRKFIDVFYAINRRSFIKLSWNIF